MSKYRICSSSKCDNTWICTLNCDVERAKENHGHCYCLDCLSKEHYGLAFRSSRWKKEKVRTWKTIIERCYPELTEREIVSCFI